VKKSDNTSYAEINVFPGAHEDTPSLSQYFSWINNTNEGSTEEQTLANLEFFAWMRDEYGMRLDIYAFDAGAIDGKCHYGNMESKRFKRRFPNGFRKIQRRAEELGIRIGIWCGPDGFGDSEESAEARLNMMVELCRDYRFILFKMDNVCGPLRDDKDGHFIKMMTECRRHCPDLILLNHRLGLSPEATSHATTFLWEGKESYTDCMTSANTVTATHHRVNSMQRGLPPELKRLTEDHGVCLSSCLDFWDDELILQAFNRCLILAPEIYGNPWLLRDDEFPKLARIYNLHRRYRDIMVNGIQLPEEDYGPFAVSRGDRQTRVITLRNLTWNSLDYHVRLGNEIGLGDMAEVELRQYHPRERLIGRFGIDESVSVSVPPFRACLLIASAPGFDSLGIEGVDYDVVQEVEGRPISVDLMAPPGSRRTVAINRSRDFSKAELEGKDVSSSLRYGSLDIVFEGAALRKPCHRLLGVLCPCSLPEDTEQLYEATCFAADNNALEVRSLERSGPSGVTQVKNARDMFFGQERFRERGVWDRFMFDDDPNTSFYASQHHRGTPLIEGGGLRLDFGWVEYPDEIVIKVKDEFSIYALRLEEGNHVEVSCDLKSWTKIPFFIEKESCIHIPEKLGMRYLRFEYFNGRVASIQALKDGTVLNNSLWRASNLFGTLGRMKFDRAWMKTLVIDEAAEGSYLCIAINGIHGIEGAYAAMRAGDEYIGAVDRAPSFPCNGWENTVTRRETGYTYYFPVKTEMLNRELDVFVLGRDFCSHDLIIEAWLTCADMGYRTKRLTIY
jgi:hypothetical protein